MELVRESSWLPSSLAYLPSSGLAAFSLAPGLHITSLERLCLLPCLLLICPSSVICICMFFCLILQGRFMFSVDLHFLPTVWNVAYAKYIKCLLYSRPLYIGCVGGRKLETKLFPARKKFSVKVVEEGDSFPTE